MSAMDVRDRVCSCEKLILRVQELEEVGVPADSVKIRYSPFSRTTETARAVAGVLGIPFEAPSCKVSGLTLDAPIC